MKPQVTIDRDHAIAYVKLSEEGPSSWMREVARGVVLDVGASGDVVGIELLEPYIDKLDALIAIIGGEKP